MNATSIPTMLVGIAIGLTIYVGVSMAIYSPLIFGSLWQKYKKLSGDDIKDSGFTFLFSLLSGLLGMKILGILALLTNVSTPLQGIILGLLLATFGSTYRFNQVIYDKKIGMKGRFFVWLIDSFNVTVIYVLAGSIFGIIL